MKKSTQKGFTLLLFAFISVISFSQTREEMRNTLASHLKEAKIHAKNIENGFTKTKADQEKQIEEILLHIDAAEKANEYLKKTIPKTDRRISKVYNRSIDRYQTYAANHSKAIRKELKKQKEDQKKIRKHAKKIGEGLTQAEEVNKNGSQIKN